VGVHAVNGKTDQLGIDGTEIFLHAAEGHELSGADRGEICRVAEKDDPFPLVIGREVNVALGGLGRKSGSRITDQRQSEVGCVFVHVRKSSLIV